MKKFSKFNRFKNLSGESLLAFQKAYIRFAQLQRYRIPQSRIEKLLKRLSSLGLRLPLLPIKQDKHCRFRVISELVFKAEYEFKLMRTCLATQLNEYRDIYAKLFFDGDFDKLQSCMMGVKDDGVSQKICYQLACDLFNITLWVVNDNECKFVEEIRPIILDVKASRQRETDLVLEKGVFWILSSEDFGVQPLSCLTNGYFTHGYDDIEILRDKALKNNRSLLPLCTMFLNNQFGTPLSWTVVNRHQYRFSEFGYRHEKMIGDGNCLIRALSYLILRSQEEHPKMREIIVHELKRKPKRYEKFCTLRRKGGPSEKSKEYKEFESYEDYCARMSENHQWGDRACIQAALDLFKLKLILVNSAKGLVLEEIYPRGKKYYAEIHCCITSIHMDVVVPEEWSPFVRFIDSQFSVPPAFGLIGNY